jgi:ribosomal protein S18 acetylase RimI-like enzyme
MIELKFRQAYASDINQIMELTSVANGQFRSVISKQNFEEWDLNLNNENTYNELFTKGVCFVCEDKWKIVGSSVVVPHGNPYKWFESEWSYLRLIAVHPDYEGKGIGKKLTLLCIEFAKTSGEHTIVLHTSEFQNAARHIYENIGFKKVKEFKLHDKKYWIYMLQLKTFDLNLTSHV